MDKCTFPVTYLPCVAPLLSTALFQMFIFLLNCICKRLQEFVPISYFCFHIKYAILHVLMPLYINGRWERRKWEILNQDLRSKLIWFDNLLQTYKSQCKESVFISKFTHGARGWQSSEVTLTCQLDKKLH